MHSKPDADAAPAAKERLPLWSWLVLIGAVLLVVALAIPALYIDDWSRDLTSNTAETAFDSEDELMRPLMVPLAPPEARDLVQRTAQSLPRWTVASGGAGQAEAAAAAGAEDDAPAGAAADDATAASDQLPAKEMLVLDLVHETPLMKYRDDVTVTIEPSGTGSTIHVASRSRVGKGDLGQNPRNIKELLGAVRAELARRAAPAGGDVAEP